MTLVFRRLFCDSLLVLRYQSFDYSIYNIHTGINDIHCQTLIALFLLLWLYLLYLFNSRSRHLMTLLSIVFAVTIVKSQPIEGKEIATFGFLDMKLFRNDFNLCSLFF